MAKYFDPPERICPYCGRVFKSGRIKKENCGDRKCRTRHMHLVVDGKAKRVRHKTVKRPVKPKFEIYVDADPGW